MINSDPIEELKSLLQTYKNQILPGIYDKRLASFEKLQILQQKNLLLARSYYLLIFHLYFSENKIMHHDDITIDILTTNFDRIQGESPLDSFGTQVFLNAIKQFYNNPQVFASSLLNDQNLLNNIPIFAFSTFPALFGFFTSEDLFKQASRFLFELITLRAPDKVLIFLILSFFLSNFSFTDALWHTFYLNVSPLIQFKEETISDYLSKSISECSALISQSTHEVLKELLTRNSNLIATIFINYYLPITFELWLNHSNAGMSFSHGKEIINFFNQIKNTQRAILLSALFVMGTGRLSTTPSYFSSCAFSSEILYFSMYDIKTFVEAFKSLSAQIELYDTLVETSQKCEEAPFMTFPVTFCMSIDKVQRRESIFQFPHITLNEENEPDPIFEQLRLTIQRGMITQQIEQSSIYNSDAFQHYLLTKNLADCVEEAKTQEYLIDLEIDHNIAKSFQRSLLNLRRYLFSEYISQFIKESQFTKGEGSIDKKSLRLLENCDDKFLYIPTLIEAINESDTNQYRAPKDYHSRFLTITRSQIENNWKQAGQIGQIKYVLSLVPLLSKRKDLNIGQYFYLLDQCFRDARTITSHYFTKSNIEEEMSMLIQTIIQSANTEIALDIFLYFEKNIFRNIRFLSLMSPEQLKNWNLFIQMMWKTIEIDGTLFKQCIAIEIDSTEPTDKKKS